MMLIATTCEAQWTNLDSGTMQELAGVTMLDPEAAWSFGSNGTLLRTVDGGGTWSTVAIPFAEDINTMMRYDYLGMLLFGDDGALLRSDDLGVSWALEQSPVGNELTAVARYGTSAIAVGEEGAVIRSVDNGATWVAGVSGTLADLNAVIMTSLTNAWAVGRNGSCLQSMDGGATWSLVTVPFTGDLNDLVMVDDLTILICGEEGTVLRSADNGLDWTTTATVEVDELNALWVDGSGVIRAAGSGGVIVRSIDGGLVWNTDITPTSGELTDIVTGSETGFAVGVGGTILKLSDTVDGVAESVEGGALLLFPNPSTGDVNIKLEGATLHGPLVVEVRTADGRLVDRATTERMVRPARMFGLTPGQYVVSVSGADGKSFRENLIVNAR